MADRERDDSGAVLRDALIREGVALAVMMAVLWYLGPGKIWLAGIRKQAAARWQRRGAWIDAQAAEFNRQVSRWDHEQSSQADRGPAGGGGSSG